MDKSELTSKFHLMAGSFIAGKIFTEYLFLLKDMFDHKIKGQTTQYNRVVEAEAKAIKVVDILGVELKAIGCDLGVTEMEIEGIEETLYAILTLESKDQVRVLNLIKKIKNDSERHELLHK